MPISYPTSGYSFTPQFAQTGALQGLQPLDVTRGATFQPRPLAAIEIQSARPELVAQGIAKGIEAAVGGITSGITAKWKAEKEKEAATTKYQRDVTLAQIRSSKDDDSWWDKQEARFIAEHGGDADFEERLAALRAARPTISKSLPESVKKKTPEIVDADLPTGSGSYDDVSLAPGGKTITETKKGAYQGTPSQIAAQKAEDAAVAAPVSATYQPSKTSKFSFGAGILEPTAEEVVQTPALVGISSATAAEKAPSQQPALAAVKPESVTPPTATPVAAVTGKPPEVDYTKYPEPKLPSVNKFKTRDEAEAVKQSIETNPDWDVVVSKPDSKGWSRLELKSKRKDRIEEERKVWDDYYKQQKDIRAESKAELEAKIKGAKIPNEFVALDDQVNTAAATVRDINAIIDIVEKNPNAVGKMGAKVAALWPFDTDASKIRGLMESVNSSTALTALINMRKASPTGAAVGQASDKDMMLFKSSEGAIDPDRLDDKQFINRLNSIKEKRIKAIEEATGKLQTLDKNYEKPILEFPKEQKPSKTSKKTTAETTSKQDKNALIAEKDALLTKIATGSEEYKKSAEYQKDYNRALQINELIK